MNARSKFILKSFLSHDPTNFTHAFIACVRPILEYSSLNWSPYNIYGIDTIENTQRTFTRNLKAVSYDERLGFLGLQSLEVRRIYTDLMFTYILTHSIVSSVCLKSMINYSTYTSSRGHRHKMFIARTHKLV